jgi:hypothetical protein
MLPGTHLPADNLDFAWDRPETAETLRARLDSAEGDEWLLTAAWVMREARVEEVWQFLTLHQVSDHFPALRPLLGRRLPVWEHLLRVARELGRI